MNILTFLISESESIKFEFDLFETNIINLILLISLLVVVGRNFLGSQLSGRQQKILQSIEDSEMKLNKANIRLIEAYKQLDQLQLVLDQTKEKSKLTRELSLKEKYNETNQQISLLFKNARLNLTRSEQQMYDEVKENFANIVLTAAIGILKSTLTEKDHRIINKKYLTKLETHTKTI